MTYRTTDELTAGFEQIQEAPADEGRVMQIVRRPAIGEREILAEGVVDPGQGLVGDTWTERPSRRMPEGTPHPEMQLTLMNARCAALVAGEVERWGLAGDQLYVDFDIGVENLPPGTRLQVGSAVIEVTSEPHTGCAKFAHRFGQDAMRFVNSPEGRAMRLRGMNTKIIVGGTVRPGDIIRKA